MRGSDRDMNREKAFVFIELMIIVAIIAIFAAGLAIPRFIKAREKAERNVCLTDRDLIERAEQRYFMNKEEHSTALQDLVDEGYLKTMPECPSGGVYAWVSYPEDDPDYQTELGCSIHGDGDGDDDEDDDDDDDDDDDLPDFIKKAKKDKKDKKDD